MAQICIPAPPLDEMGTVYLDVTIDGQATRIQYRVETLIWEGDSQQRMDALRSFIADRGNEWLLVQIGTPSKEQIPLLFRLRTESAGPPAQIPSGPSTSDPPQSPTL